MKLKIAMVTTYPGKDEMISGGVDSVAHCLVGGLHRISDLDIHIVAPTYKSSSGLEKRGSLTIHWLKMPSIPACLSNWSIYRQTVHSCLAEINPDITHFQNVASWSIGYQKPYLITIHGIYEKDMLYKDGIFLSLRRALVAFTERIGRKASPHTILISPYVLDEIGEQVRGRHWHIENPVSSEFFNIERTDAGPRVLYVGRISRRKNIDGLLRAFSIVKQKVGDATLHIAGTPESSEYLNGCMKYIEENGLGSSVHFLGNVDRPGLIKLLGEASCLALVSFQETAPMAVEEAMAGGVPVVASRICGLPFMIEDRSSGFLVEPGSDEQIATGLVELLKDREVNNAMGRRCREVSLERFHVDLVAEKTLSVYHHILSEPQN